LTRASRETAYLLGLRSCTADRKSAGTSGVLEVPAFVGGPSRTRTLDPLIKSEPGELRTSTLTSCYSLYGKEGKASHGKGQRPEAHLQAMRAHMGTAASGSPPVPEVHVALVGQGPQVSAVVAIGYVRRAHPLTPVLEGSARRDGSEARRRQRPRRGSAPGPGRPPPPNPLATPALAAPEETQIGKIKKSGS
jgi:hypothetical protein